MQRITITPSQVHDNQIVLTTEQHHYLTHVIRLRTGDEFEAIDGKGSCYLAAITAAGAQIIRIAITVSQEFTQPIILICALPKGNNFDDLVRACTELGVTTIIPAISDRTLLNPSPQKLQRWRKIAQEAAEQSERLVVPTIEEPRSLKTIFEELIDPSDKYLCEARGEHPHLLTIIQSIELIDMPIIIAIGPEGGWTDGEIDLAIEHNFQLVSLGARILRTITAPIVALSIVSAAIDSA
ncbi:MAG: 16S rRNA (uracil(1498)-N(3))-methyltransferase, partial [Chamaesiphon sp.]|nr:16S rRNA (uracil(1498)-N(3))-methyltransferase [Chamaesiphon sp.]